MRTPKEQNYSYAINADNKLIHVNAAVRSEIYTCPYCGAQMTPHMGKVRKWHFTHKANLENCNYESYLHKVAKTRIKAAFDASPHFFILYDAIVHCKNRSNCNLTNENRCCKTDSMRYDLKEYYDTCLEEQTFQSFRADLLLSSSHKKLDPVLIEIFVTHKSTKEKIQSKVRIIEIEIMDEEAIDNICNSQTLSGVLELNILERRRKSYPIVFYNFKLEYMKSYEEFRKRLDRFNYYLYVFPNGKYEMGKCHCYEDVKNLIPKNADYIVGDYEFDCAWALSILFKHIRFLRSCLICKFCNKEDFQNSRVCSYYHRKLLSDYAVTCKNFSKLLYEESKSILPEWVDKIKYDVCIRNYYWDLNRK